jgi:hypothetical protein
MTKFIVIVSRDWGRGGLLMVSLDKSEVQRISVTHFF